MPAPTNPKKRALMPSTRLRKTLRAAGHHLSPVVQVGKEGVTEAVLRQLDEALATHELVKVKIGTESPEDRFEAADRLGEETGGQVAQILGRTILVYRRHPEKPRYEAAPARAGLKELESPTPRARGKAKRAPGARKPRPARGTARGAARPRSR
jgi:RNA-binding protein